ncbi:TonB-dependent receptor [Candidatus Methylobacter favarea]|uniref:TonB-dependent receptor n=1 Tax=Candidatus Methylobacter favarea TaxID=2707345 RepID=A0A8S0X7D0_9GAMM|nr:FecR domain-containing protein [Candidatus Methylobacter favarea]CAA9889947.1 TonB-dependent receptor [Candidatus Methylobacter favarea]
MSHYLEASPLCTQPVARVVSVQGKVDRQASGNSEWQIVQTDDTFCPGDKIRTEKRSRAILRLSNESLVTLDQSTTLLFSEPEENTSTWLLNLIDGSTFFRSRQPQRLKIQTPFINAVHEGTEFLVTVDDQQTKISVFDGQIMAENEAGRIQIKKGFSGIAKKNQPPRLQALTIIPEDAVQWTLYYPPIIDYQHLTSSISTPYLKSALAVYQQGDVYQALAILDEVPASYQDSEYLTLKASLLLAVGRVDEALNSINQAQRSQHGHSTVMALQSVIAVAKNHPHSALELALKAVALNPKSSVAKIALSYAYQSLFKIEEALIATEQATQLAPDNALAWARLSELQLSLGDHDGALVSAQKAQSLNPKLARTQIILGFADLAQVDIDAAKRAFEQAIAYDSSDPLARLGLGLAKIRKGALEEGTRDIETAVSLDPDNAVARSYLGKAYYELRNRDYADTELNLSKEMDSKDPTPWFYDAILKQTTNRPVEALHDMQKAIELNDNRGVYRSKLLLDEDLAARSAAQGRIYNDLGFQRLGLLEGWNSVNTDPANYSAHRLLADNYASQPRHEIARVSELLQSQLLQPINITPIQPQLSQSNILVVDGLGPSALSFNEFNPLFARNRFALQTSGIFGSNNTWGEDVVHSGLWNKASYSLGQFHYETDGFKKNNFLNQDIYNAFVQGEVTNFLNLQAEYRHEERKNGDLSVNFDPNDFSSSFKENRKIDTYRIGGRYIFSPKSSFIGSLIYQDVDIVQKQVEERSFFNRITNKNQIVTFINGSQIKRRGFISELQHQYIDNKYSLISGFGHIDQTVDQIDFALIPGGRDIPSKPDITRINFYSYLKLNNIDKVAATLGVSYDTLEINNLLKRSPVNPKFGLVWNPISSTTFRAAFFRGMNITRTSNQTIEPTQIAGFNQLFDDPNGTVAWRYGAAIDHKFSKNISAGFEYSERKLDVPIGRSSANWNEQLSRAYLYLTPYSLVSLSVEYFYEQFNRQENPADTGIINVKTHRVPVTINIFHPSGLSLMLKTSYVNQSGVFEKGNAPLLGSSDFYIVDLDVNYRLPSRYGMISFGLKNLFDNRFQYQSNNSFLGSNSNETLFALDRTLFTRIKLAF